MTEVETLAACPVPRSAAFVEPFACALEPTSSFVGPGMLWGWLTLTLFVAVSIGGSIAVTRATGHPLPVPGSILASMSAVGGILFVVLWIGFSRWVGRRRDAARRLYARGVLLDGRICGVRSTHGPRGSAVVGADVEFTPEGSYARAARISEGGRPFFRTGERCTILYEPTVRIVVVHRLEGAAAGKAVAGKLLGGG